MGVPTPNWSILDQFTCRINGVDEIDGYPQPGTLGPNGFKCYASVVVAVLGSSVVQIGNWSLSQVIGEGFEVKYKVEKSRVMW